MDNNTPTPTTHFGKIALIQLGSGLLAALLGKASAEHFAVSQELAERLQFFGYMLVFLSGIFAILFFSTRMLGIFGKRRQKELVGLPAVFILVWLAFWIYVMPDLIPYLTPGK